jgi:hypothetical protein
MNYQFDPPPEWLLEAARNAQGLVDSPAIAAAIDVAQRLTPLIQDIQARADALDPVRSTLEHLASFNSVASVLERQRGTMAIIAGTANWAVPTPPDLKKAEATLLAHLPETDVQIEEVAQAVAGIEADPKWRELIERMTSTLKKADLTKVPRAAIPVLMYWWLCHRPVASR